MDMAKHFCLEIIDPLFLAIIRNFVRVDGGVFLMGSPDDEVDRKGNETQHQVKVSTFYLCKYAVNVADFKTFIDESGYQTDAEKGDGSNVLDGKKGWKWEKKTGVNWRHGVSANERDTGEYNHPVLYVSWNDAEAYCSWLSQKSGKSFRLPTEAEWEYACRAGEMKPFSTGDNLTTEQGNYCGDLPYNNNEKGIFRKNTVPVNSFEPNAWGLYNMHGNVWEWCRDWYVENYYERCKENGVIENPAGPETGSSRVLRGGSWCSPAGRCQSANRNRNPPGGRIGNAGFRLVFVP